MNVTIWHNPRCSKSRQTLALLEERLGENEITIVRYLDNAPSKSELESVARDLGVPASGIIRTGESLYKELGLKGKSDEALFEAMASHPKLIERPVVLVDGTNDVVIGRPPENVIGLFDE